MGLKNNINYKSVFIGDLFRTNTGLGLVVGSAKEKIVYKTLVIGDLTDFERPDHWIRSKEFYRAARRGEVEIYYAKNSPGNLS